MKQKLQLLLLKMRSMTTSFIIYLLDIYFKG